MTSAADDLLREHAVSRALERAVGRAWHAPVHVVVETGSTNDDAKALAKGGAPSGTVVVADAQTAGRGRSGATWHSPPGENLYFSLVLRSPIAAADVAPFSLVAGLAVADAIQARIRGRALVKWPNDVHVNRRKLAGVLVEAQVRGEALASIVVGVGINVTTSSFPPPLDQTAGSLALLGATDLDRASLAADLAVRLEAVFAEFSRSGYAGFAPRIAERDALRGRRVRVGDVEGVASGIDDTGRLLITRDGVATPIVAGHVEIPAAE